MASSLEWSPNWMSSIYTGLWMPYNIIFPALSNLVWDLDIDCKTVVHGQHLIKAQYHLGGVRDAS